MYRYIQHYIANVKYILHLAKQFLLFINNTGHMYPERSGEHPSTVPSGHGSRGKESTEKGAGQKRPGRTDTEKDETGKKDAAKQH